MQEGRSGRLPWTTSTACTGASRPHPGRIRPRHAEAKRRKDHLNRAWHARRPGPTRCGPETPEKRLPSSHASSNGNVSLLTNYGKNAGLPLGLGVLSAELFSIYKPDPEAYLGAAAMLGFEPHEVMMVRRKERPAARRQAASLRAAFVQRPLEFGDRRKKI